MRRRGASLATVLAVTAVSVLLMLAVASVGLFNLHMATGLDQREHARNLAESAIQRAIAEMVDHPDYGLANEVVTIPRADYPGPAQGRLSFNPSAVHYSTNNLAGSSAVPGDGRAVPPRMAHLMGHGRCGDVDCWIECLYYRPAFPLGIAATGKVDLRSVSLVGLVPNASFNGDWSAVPEQDRLPAHLFTNSNLDEALHLGLGCDISGGAGAVGGIQVANGAHVAGELRPHSNARDIPSMDVPGLFTRASTQLGATGLVEPVGDICVVANNVNLDHDLQMEGGVLAVQGNLTVDGTIRGRGAVIVTGDATFRGGSDLVAGRQCALVAGGNITLQSPDRDSFFFQGLLYAGHTIAAEKVTVVGALIANGPGALGDVHLDNVRVVTTPLAVESRIGYPQVQNVGINAWGANDDSVRMRFYSEGDPARPGEFLLYGHYEYRCNPLNAATGLPDPTKSGWGVVWGPGPPSRSYWQVLPGIEANLLRPLPATPQAYSGRRDALIADLQQILACDTTNADHYPLVESAIGDYLDSLEGRKNGDTYLELNLNRLLAPTEASRILWEREL